jgi:transposase InsO family protein
MRVHANAPLSPKGRLVLCRRVEEQGWTLGAAAEAAGLSVRSAGKWLGRYRCEGEAGLCDRPSTPRSIPHRTPEDRVEAIAALRRLRMTGAEIAECLGMALSTVSAVLVRIGLGKLSRLEPPEPPNRYERSRPGELVHIDVKKLGRILAAGHRVTSSRATQNKTRRERKRVGLAGWEFVHVCVDDATRLAYVEVLADERATTAIAFLGRAVAFFQANGIRVERVMTDNGSAYRSAIHAIACRTLGIRHLRTRPYRPRTNGKAERFIRTILGSWAYGAIYGTSAERTAALPGWLEFYNWRRPHGSLNKRAPGTRLHELNNVTRSYT